MDLAEISGIASADVGPIGGIGLNGGIIITEVPEPSALGLLAVGAVALLVRGIRNGGTKVSPSSSPKTSPGEQ